MIRKDSPKRSLAKTVTWRIVGALDTSLISWALTGDPLSGLQMGSADALSKMVFFYFHERLWEFFNTEKNERMIKLQEGRNRRIHLYKAITWRIFSSSLTVMLGWLILNDPWMGLKIGIIEVFTKILLYYLHERIWFKTDFGVTKKPVN